MVVCGLGWHLAESEEGRKSEAESHACHRDHVDGICHVRAFAASRTVDDGAQHLRLHPYGRRDNANHRDLVCPPGQERYDGGWVGSKQLPVLDSIRKFPPPPGSFLPKSTYATRVTNLLPSPRSQLLYASGFLFMAATEEQMLLISNAGVSHVSYILILYSFSFLLFLCK
jgi:hypothetical protein